MTLPSGRGPGNKYSYSVDGEIKTQGELRMVLEGSPRLSDSF